MNTNGKTDYTPNQAQNMSTEKCKGENADIFCKLTGTVLNTLQSNSAI